MFARCVCSYFVNHSHGSTLPSYQCVACAATIILAQDKDIVRGLRNISENKIPHAEVISLVEIPEMPEYAAVASARLKIKFHTHPPNTLKEFKQSNKTVHKLQLRNASHTYDILKTAINLNSKP